MSSITPSNLNNEELREALRNKGLDVGPIGPSTRKLYEKKLVQVIEKSIVPDLNGSVIEINGTISESRRSLTPELSNGSSIRRSASPAIVQQQPTYADASRSDLLQNGENGDINKTDTDGKYLNEKSPSPIIEDKGSDSDSSLEELETSRVLSAEEAVTFRSKLFSSTSSTTSFDRSRLDNHSSRNSKVSARNTVSTLTNKHVLKKVGVFIAGFALFLLIVAILMHLAQENYQPGHFSSSGVKDEN